MKKLIIAFLLLLLTGCNHNSATKEDTQSPEKAFLKEFTSRYNESIDSLTEMENMPTLPKKIDLESDIKKENNKDTYTQIVASETDSSDNGFLNYQLNINYDKNKNFTGFHMQAFGTTKELPVKSIGCAVILLDSLDLDYERAASFFDDNKYDDEWTENGYKIKFKRTPIINIACLYI
ncbi:hypothetical protein J7E26_15030 [Bacillus sp. ISL-51]|uniref:hypothetical protein n=1 Tax=Bacteria TaxID=2 RepID=UPI001BECEDE6|nr:MULTISPECIES: hypothetical protein [Bacteria]MBT2575240.1 hypothetical protein [Bacillus sp. ISL-51]MBT2633533.1 hypothetical protein [Bacillus sp. ISL-26]MBT2714031.1 hypothetical protein [Pseudomonas sp. ISL-88]